jgi:hypothetical protein
MPTLDAPFSREEAARLLAIPRYALDLLIEHKVLPAQVTAGDLEAYCRDALLRVYQAAAEQRLASRRAPEPERELEFDLEPHDVSAAGEPPMLDVVRSFEEGRRTHDARHAELRRAPRYDTGGELTGKYRDVEFTILEVSATGLRIRHDESLPPGDEARVTFTLPSQATITFRARVAWTTISQRGSGPSYCMSGLQVTANVDHLQKAVEYLRTADRRKKAGARTPPALVGLSDDDVASIIRAYRRFTSDPVEAGRWYSRARFSVVDETVRRAAPEKARDREEVLGIWEYLERKVAIDAVTNVVGWLRQTRSAAAV